MNTRQEFEETYKENHYSLWWNSSNDLFLTDERGCYYDRDVRESWEVFLMTGEVGHENLYG